jgi:MFS family permease
MNSIFSHIRHRLSAFIGRFNPGIWFITIVGFLNSAGFAISLPFIALYLHQDRHLPMTVIGVIIIAGGLASAAVQLYAGALCDRLGRRPLLVVSVFAGAGLYAVLAVLVYFEAPVWLIVTVYTLVRCALMMQRPAIQAMIVDLCPRERLVEANGIMRIGQNLGWATGPALGGYLLASISYAWLFGVAAIISGMVIFSVVFLVKESCLLNGERLTLAGIFSASRNRYFLVFVILCTLFFVSMGQMTTTLSVFSVDRAGFSLEQYGVLLTLNGLLVALLQYPVARLVNRLPHSRVLQAGSLLYALGYLVMGLVGSYWVAFTAMVIITLGEITTAPTMLAVVGETAPSGQRGRYMGFYGLSETIGVSTGPLLGGILLDNFANNSMAIWGVIGLVALLAGFGFFFWGRPSSHAGLSNTSKY